MKMFNSDVTPLADNLGRRGTAGSDVWVVSDESSTPENADRPTVRTSTQDGGAVMEPEAEGSNSNGTSWKLYCGDSRKVLADLPKSSVNCVVTSPPYFWQRDYGVDGQLGMESTIDGFVSNIRDVFAGLDHVLTDDGVVWLNLGDTYYSAKGRPHGKDEKHRSRRMAQLRAVDGPGLGLPRKSLIGIPWRTALALQEDGWTLRAEVIWQRKTAIPEPTAKDRPWRQHEKLFLFSKSPRYLFNRAALNGNEDVWVIEPERNSIARGTHYAPYPRELVQRCIATGCPDGGTVLDPFVGGGTTMSVAMEMGRNAVGVELNPDFCGHIATVLDGQAMSAGRRERLWLSPACVNAEQGVLL